MSTDTFEHELRMLLHETADAQGPAYVDVAPDEVLARGRRVVRRRRAAMAGGTVAAALVVGVGAWAVLDQSTRRGAEPVPATRSADAVAPDVVSATVAAVEGGPVRSYTVHLERATGAVTATATLASGDTVQAGAVGRVPVGERRAVWATVSSDPFIVVGVVPTADQLLTRVEGGDVGGVTTADAPLSTTPYEAFLVETEKSPAGAALAGLDYAVGGRVFAADGSELASAGFPGPRAVYLDRAAGELGLVTPDGGARRPLDRPAAGAPLGHLTTAVRADGEPTVATFVVVLPIEAGDVRVRVAAGATLTSTEERPLLGGAGVAVVATVQAPDSTTPAVTGVSWVAEGRPVSWRNPD